MTHSSLILTENLPENTPAVELKHWLSDLDQHGDTLLAAIRSGRVRVMTEGSFADVAERLRAGYKAYADEALKSSVLIAQKTVLTNTLYYLLKSCEGIALNADKIAELLAVLPQGEALDARAVLGILMDAKKRDTILQNGRLLAGAFDASWLGRIDVGALALILSDAGIDFSAYARLAELMKYQQSSTPQTPLIHG